ncbi:histidine kinase [Paenarthrobacter sp. NPDC056912]|uniref:histidine kinase n=1 Tax=Paenarthrobacter sp. NPDC056912 TaxID=3345965 RepID=UPI003672FB79
MRDVVARSLSQADGARYAAAVKPEFATEALATIASTGRESLGDMRRLLGVLSADQAAVTHGTKR